MHDNTNPQNAITKCAIYTRVSTDEQTRKDYNSLESQRDICRHAIAVKQELGWIESAAHEDGGYSGKDLHRPGIQQLLAEVRDGEVDAIIVYKIDRLTRSISDFYALWKILQQHNVVFVSATQSFDTSTPMGNLMLNMLLSFGQFERELTSERVRQKYTERAKKGLWNGGWVPIGYAYDKATKRLSPNPGEVPIIKQLFRLTKKLASPTAVASALNEEGLVTKTREITMRSGQTKMIGGKRWIGDRVKRIVENPIYKGVIAHGGEQHAGEHKALVSEALWKDANEALASMNAPARPHAARNKHGLLLKGILRCDHCGNLMTPKPSGKKDSEGNPYLYYSCGDVTKDGSNSPCELRNISSRPFEEFVVKVIAEIGKRPDIIATTLEATKKESRRSLRPLKSKLAEIGTEWRQVTSDLTACIEFAKKSAGGRMANEMMAEGESLADRKHILGIEREKIEMDIARKEQMIADEAIIADALTGFEKVFDSLPFEDQQELVRLLIREIRVSRTDPGDKDFDANPSVYHTQIRTSWYRLNFQFYVTPSKPTGNGNGDTSSHLNRNGGQGGIRTHGTVSSSHL